MRMVAPHVAIRVPAVIAFDATAENELCLPWILMEYIEGSPLEDQMKHLSIAAKERIVEKIADFLAVLYGLRFQGIGSLHLAALDPDKTAICHSARINNFPVHPWVISILVLIALVTVPKALLAFVTFVLLRSINQRTQPSYVVGPIHSRDLVNTGYDNELRKPFTTGLEWALYRLEAARLSSEDTKRIGNIPADTRMTDEEFVESIDHHLRDIARLVDLASKVLDDVEDCAETSISSDDLHSGNIMVDREGEITGIIDWEFVHTQPLWMACSLPKLLVTPLHPNCPDQRTFEDPEDPTYHEILEYHHNHHLRQVFLERMGTLHPEWLQQYHAGKKRRDLFQLIYRAQTDHVRGYELDCLRDMEQGTWNEDSLSYMFLGGDDDWVGSWHGSPTLSRVSSVRSFGFADGDEEDYAPSTSSISSIGCLDAADEFQHTQEEVCGDTVEISDASQSVSADIVS
ncbi:hypothetical protein IAU60_000788 [Kwoniella sp. DSM 27419]